jgi:two-component system, NarL family, nitrate/nitrite response regulator NarL
LLDLRRAAMLATPMRGEPIRVYIAEDHPLYKDGLTRMIQRRPAFALVGEASDGRTSLEEIKELRPDVALVDLQMPELDGLAVLNAIRRDGVRTKVILLSGGLGREVVYRAVAAGADGVLPKTAGPEDLASAIIAVADGETVLPAELHSGLADEIRRRGAGTGPKLSAREQEVLRLTAEGCSAAEIGERIYITAGTVKTHLQGAYHKLGVSDRAAAVAEAMRRGLLE